MSWSAPTTVVVFDYKIMKNVLQLKFNQQLQDNTVVPDVAVPALSPDGTRVAVLTGKVLKLFRVPD